MLTIHGKSISGMVTIGPLRIFRHQPMDFARTEIEKPETEVARFDSARNAAAVKMKEFYQEAISHVGLDNASIFKVYQQMMTDSEFVDAVKSIIRKQSVNAEYAVQQAEQNFTRIYEADPDDYVHGQIADLAEVARILLRTLRQKQALFSSDEPCILYADDLTPSETIQMDTTKILGFVTKEGTPTSHTAILARALGVPAIVATGTDVDASHDGKTAVIDGFSGVVYLEPTPAILSGMKEKQSQSIHLKELLLQLKGLPSETIDGHRIEVAANVSSASDLSAVLKNDAEGIGLFRSEFIYMGRETLPSEEEQFNIYKLAIETMAGKRVIIRTLDIGADKEASAFHLPKEDNPALGLRAIRISLKRPEIFKVQLRAILRASAYGKAAIMFPLITSVWEVWKAKEILTEQSSGKLLSLEQMEEDALLPDYVGAETAPSAETEALEREELRNLAEQKQILLLALLSLKDTDRELINALFFDGASTREYAQRMGVSQRAVIKRRDRILRDLKKFFENSSK